MPGVTVVTTTRPAPGTINSQPAGNLFVAGLTERGDTTGVVLIRSMQEYSDLLGARVAYGALYDQLQTFFAEGGQRAYVARVVGASATVGTLTVNDRSGGAGVATVRFDAPNAGAWSTGVSVAVADGSLPNTVKVTVTYGGVTVESYDNLATPAAIVAAFANSNFVRAVDLASATAAPGNNPKITAATPLSAGGDDRGTVVAGDYITALARFDTSLGAGAVAIPGQTSANVGAGIIAHCTATNRRTAILSVAVGSTNAAAKAAANAIRGSAGSEFAGLFYPWVVIPDGSGGTRTISPEGYVAGVRARTFLAATRGPGRAPAGDIAQARFVVGVERSILRAEGDDLNASDVNVIRIIAGTTRLYGWRSLSIDDANYQLLTGREVLNALVVECETALEPFVFRSIDARGQLFAEVEGALRGVIEPYRARGALYERLDPVTLDVIDPGYAVDAGLDVNTATTLAANTLAATMAFRVAPTAELTALIITKVAFDQAVA